jgi:hypothetical protein
MAFSAIAAATLAYDIYGGVSANQKSQKAKGDAQTLIDNQTKQLTTDQANASAAASQAGAIAKKRAVAAGGQESTILTGPQGAPAATTQRKTLLGL